MQHSLSKVLHLRSRILFLTVIGMLSVTLLVSITPTTLVSSASQNLICKSSTPNSCAGQMDNGMTVRLLPLPTNVSTTVVKHFPNITCPVSAYVVDNIRNRASRQAYCR